MLWLTVFITGGGLLFVDRWLKDIALQGVTRDFGFAKFLLFKNDALVFSLAAPKKLILWLISAAGVIIVMISIRMLRQGNVRGAIGGLFILIGAGSNVYDRLTFGFVIDWANFGMWWPVFNLADVMIGVGLVMMIVLRPRLRPAREIDIRA